MTTEIPDWVHHNIAAVAGWMQQHGYESWVVQGIGPIPNKIVLHGKATDPEWFFIAERKEQPFHNKLPVYATIDPIQPANPSVKPDREAR